MNIKFCLNIVGSFIKILGLLMLIPAACPLIYGEDDLGAFCASSAVTLVIGFVIKQFTHSGRADEIERRDGFLIAAFFWIAASLLGSLPYLFYGVFPNPVDALFESTAGFTTTGASVISDIESLPHGMLLWRNFTQWLGGMGIVALAIAVLPRLSIGGGRLMALEAPGPATQRLTPRIAETAKNIWLIYAALSAVLVIALKICGMSFFDSLAHSFSTISTGGFSPRNAGISHYDDPLIEAVITVFMFIGGINFVVHYSLIKGRLRESLRGAELRFYFLLILAASIAICLSLKGAGVAEDFASAYRYASFQAVSIGTGTGFSSADFGSWPAPAVLILILLMFAGGCSGSTSGGAKVSRILVAADKCRHELRKLVYPSIVSPVRFDGRKVDEQTVSNITAFLILYAAAIILGAIAVSAFDDVSLLTAFSASLAAMANVGPGLGSVGPAENYAALSDASKGVLSFLMITGRLEIFTILVLFIPDFWRK